MKIFLLIPGFFFSANSTTKFTSEFSSYHNVRYGYSIKYPPDFLYPKTEAENGDGRIFLDKKGRERLVVFGILNQDIDGNLISLAKRFEIELKRFENNRNNKVTYKFIGNLFCVFSGYKDGQVYYEKIIKKNDAVAIAIIQYSKAEKDIYDPLTEKIMKSFQ